MRSAGLEVEAARRRAFAIISHPDAGKTTLTEKFLLYAGAVAEAGAVKARSGRRNATSDWMALEQERGISITSTVLQFTYRDHVLNLLDTPGHRDFSEDTYRVLTAADAAVMVLDVAKGVEAQTLKLFEVCRARHVPVITFLNKYDRPGRDPLGLLDEIEEQIGLRPTPVTWPVGIPGDFRGVIDRRTGDFVRYSRTARGSTTADEEVLDPVDAALEQGAAWDDATHSVELLEAVGASLDMKTFLEGESTPLFVGSALTNFGVRHLLDAVVDLAPPPVARTGNDGKERPIADAFSGQVFKIQANMDRAHRDHVAFVRICSGRFDRGMIVTEAASGRPFTTKYATSVFGSERDTIDTAYPGDVIGLVNAGGLAIGDTLYADEPISYPPIPAFSPELFVTARPHDVSRHKQFRRGLAQLEREGVVQVLRSLTGESSPVLGAVGPMQLDVVAYRLADEFGATVELTALPYTVARRTDRDSEGHLQKLRGCRVLARSDGTLLALFESTWWLDRVEAEHPEWTVAPVIEL